MSDLITATTVRQGLWPEGVSLNPDDFTRMLAAVDIDTIDGVAIDSISNVGAAFGSVTAARAPKVGIKALTGAAIHAGTGGVVSWQNPEAVSIVVIRVWLDLTTVSTGACTLDVGVTATSATTTSDTLLDGIDVNSAVGVFDSMDASLDLGANAKAQKLAAAKWVTIDEKTGDATGLVGNLYVEYVLV